MTVDKSDVFGLVGRTLADKYEVERFVARGGFGSVYYARHIELDAPVAIKVLMVPDRYEGELRAEFLDGFRLEARTLAALAHPAIARVLDYGSVSIASGETPWMARTMCGGGGRIPLRRAYDRFTATGIALVGDAACQVMPGHGSGIGFGLMAGKVLAEAVGDADDPGDADVLWRYQAAYLREFGAILAGYDAIRRMSVRLGSDGVEELFASGIFSPALVLPGLDQKLGMLSPAQTLAAARTLVTRPHLARVVVPALAAMVTARLLYAAYPRTRSDRALRAWSAVVRAVLPNQGR